MCKNKRICLYSRIQFIVSFIIAALWLVGCLYLAHPWLKELSLHIGLFFASFIILFLALIPGFMNTFIFVSYLTDRRPQLQPLKEYPNVSVLIPFHNEECCIRDTITSIMKQKYQKNIEVIAVDDGSTDNSLRILKQCAIRFKNLKILQTPHKGKAHALNTALKKAKYGHIISLDADTTLLPNAIERIITKMLLSPANTVAIAGSVYLKNSRKSFMTRLQQWEYLFGISTIKRIQSAFQGTLVAQGAFSYYRKIYLEQVGGWRDSVGEDIVLTWALLKKGYRTTHSVDAIAFTNAPSTYKHLFSQRSRWSRGMFEAFRNNPKVLFTPRLSTFFIYWNLLFPFIDITYVFVFLPGVILACFGHFDIAGPLTLAVLPLAFVYEIAYFIRQKTVFARNNITIRRDIFSFIMFVLCYNTLLAPACLHGYFSEIFNRKKKW